MFDTNKTEEKFQVAVLRDLLDFLGYPLGFSLANVTFLLTMLVKFTMLAPSKFF